MKKFEVYQNDKSEPLTVVEADLYQIRDERLEFLKNHKIIAVFNFNNIAGFLQFLEF